MTYGSLLMYSYKSFKLMDTSSRSRVPS